MSTLLEWDSVLKLDGWLLLAISAVSLTAVLRYWLGPASSSAKSPVLLVLRAVSIGCLLGILLGPTWVQQSPGPIRRPDLFLLIDASQSMAIGTQQTRWEEVRAAVKTLDGSASDQAAKASLKQFRFGHRLAAVDSADASRSILAQGQPTETDTRLADALRQLSSRFGRRRPGGVVLFSDGRVRDAGAVEQISRVFSELAVPIHVYPVGETSRGGDVAIISLVVPPKVRKYSEVEVQVFLRSYGYTGQRTEVQLLSSRAEGGDETLATVPLTLKGGAQSVSLTYRSDQRPRKLRVRIPAFADELSDRNNQLTAEVGIDRTKIRVLYLEGSDQPLRFVQRGTRPEAVGPHSALQTALTEDEDIECVSIVRLSGGDRMRRVQNLLSPGSAATGLPTNEAEFAAFDCVILSDLPSRLIEDDVTRWLRKWIEFRGGGLLMAGGPNSFRGGNWQDHPLAAAIPVELDGERFDPGSAGRVVPTPGGQDHPLWSILTDRRENKRLIESLPMIVGHHAPLTPKPLTEVLARFETGAPLVNPPGQRASGLRAGSAASVKPAATPDSAADPAAENAEPSASSSAAPAIVAGQFGRGRTLAVTWPMSGPGVEPFLTQWGPGGNRAAAKFWRNAIYWLTESSSIGRRRLVTTADKRFYRPGETIDLSAVAYDETARRTTNYRVWVMLEPQNLEQANDSAYAPVLWPGGVLRDSGETGPQIAWGEEFELPRHPETGEFRLPLELAERLAGQASDTGLRLEVTAYESDASGQSRGTQVDSTSLELQILDDPFEQQSPFPNHELLRRVAALTGGRVLTSPGELEQLFHALPIETGSPQTSRAPAWDRWSLWSAVIGCLTLEWVLRRFRGLA